MWIDFKIVFLREDSQASGNRLLFLACCELISKLYFYVRIHKNKPFLLLLGGVVNWFQNCIFTWGFTRTGTNGKTTVVLWIDFKIVFLREDSQEMILSLVLLQSCELISKLYFYVRIHKWTRWRCQWFAVVNWFQNCIFTWGFTSFLLSIIPLF